MILKAIRIVVGIFIFLAILIFALNWRSMMFPPCKKIIFDQQLMSIETCDGSEIHSVIIQDVSKYSNADEWRNEIHLKHGFKGDTKIFLKKPGEKYDHQFDTLIFPPNSSFQILIPVSGDNWCGGIFFATDQNGRVVY